MDTQNITIVDENGNETLCEILFTFESEELKKSYVIYYPVGSEDEDGNVEIFASSYDPNAGNEGSLDAIETDAEWDMIEEMIAAFDNDEEQ
ncbi:DUF1292 domain-containing protein [Culicoidibacter larvae]|uniref:UPF0473 protein FEZ08_06085 n=1 Tax=Culicoidibacter larvae TaxID=2579976 RepID=A0A5R8QE52_9FIRM|nr:DUF1292 domain-containing protein [Culicoidibacter larvae]TLG74273.1 DUF1292 domain-containing protein [Culicoidibacter larvae]